MRWRAMRHRQRLERGAATIFVIGMSIVLLVCGGLVIDGGLAINARMRAADDAEQAARVAADSINEDLLRSTGTISINQDLARARAADYLLARGYTQGRYQVTFPGEGVRVAVQDTTETTLLQLINVTKFDVDAAATAEPETEPN